MSKSHLMHKNVAQIRNQRGMSLSGLSERCGIAKSTLSKLESGEGNPTVDTLWSIAKALDCSFGQLVEGDTELRNSGVLVRLIEHSKGEPNIEVYSIELQAGSRHDANPHQLGVRERITVLSGAVYVGPVDRPRLLHAGDSFLFEADVPHFYAAKNEKTLIHVFIEYPSQLNGASRRTKYVNWPSTEVQNEAINSAITHMLTEVSNGLDAKVLRFNNAPNGLTDKDILIKFKEAVSSYYSWPLFVSVELDSQGPLIVAIRLQWSCSFKETLIAKTTTIQEDVYKLAQKLAITAQSPGFKLSNTELISMNKLAEEPSWLLSSLASEVMLQQDKIIMPYHLQSLTQKSTPIPFDIKDRSNYAAEFSSRINVDHYDAFELLHPAYARQVVATSQEIQTYASPNTKQPILDVGSGPGVPLLMLNDILTGYYFIALEPDSIAIEYLKENVNALSNIKCIQQGFLEYTPPQPHSFDIITSTGASHHFNTAFMMQKAAKLLNRDGILVISDEFIAEFANEEERQCNLILHHIGYLLHVFHKLSNIKLHCSENVMELFKKMKRGLIQAWMAALENNTAQAVNICRLIEESLRKENLPKSPSCHLGTYMRFFSLEMQAMVAGFDYEVEQKTTPLRLIELAQFAGLQLINHRRIFATHGTSEFSSGTHVFTFKRSAGFNQ